MKRILLLSGLLLQIAAMAQPGHEIKVTFKPFKNQYIYLGHYFGKTYPIIDSAKLDANGNAVFKGPKTLPGGVYLIGYPNKAGFFEILIDKQQRFSIIADTATIRNGIQFVQSPDNTLFNAYQQHMAARGREIQQTRQQLSAAKTKSDSTALYAKLGKLDTAINKYREDLIAKNPKSLLTTLLVAMREPVMPPALARPKTRQDSLTAYYYFRDHFWDGVNFYDGRLAYTTFFDEKLDKYMNELMVPNPDSVKKELDYMLGFASINEEMQRFLLLKFVNRYLNQKYMWEDGVYTHLFEKYFAQRNYAWLTENGRKIISDRYYSLAANIMGTPASEIELPDTSGAKRSLYSDTSASYTVVAFWDPTCGHCKEVLPKLDSMYQAKWKAAGLKVYAIARETDGTKADWLKFINEHRLQEWTNVYYSKDQEKSLISAGIPGYSQLYDVQTFPTLYLLDKDKRIVAKKLTWEQTDQVLQARLKGQ
jgi:thiol-disulfide isomerase/thioredoxin